MIKSGQVFREVGWEDSSLGCVFQQLASHNNLYTSPGQSMMQKVTGYPQLHNTCGGVLFGILNGATQAPLEDGGLTPPW